MSSTETQTRPTGMQGVLATVQQDWLGIMFGVLIITLAVGTCVALLLSDLNEIPPWAIAVAVFCRIFLQTGLFITAHDAIHGSVCPTNRYVNDTIGAIASFCYALFLYNFLKEKHHQHHATPSTAEDPDYYPNLENNPFLWYVRFMWGYMQKKQRWILLIGMTSIFHGLHLLFDIPYTNLMLFWAIPMFASSFQLFFFGIFLPHRRPSQGFTNSHRAKSLYFSEFWSFIACYHFGYHWEHHEYPHLPWYRLPEAIRG
ncbi:MAG: beta-carotene ketolase [Kamptonema sp. SIO4C4]|nr:beta-carotene ketolase [Kamptonema sp. SIO4C4]